MKHCTVEQVEMYGEPDQTVTGGVRPVTLDGITRITVRRHIGFLQLGQAATAGRRS